MRFFIDIFHFVASLPGLSSSPPAFPNCVPQRTARLTSQAYLDLVATRGPDIQSTKFVPPRLGTREWGVFNVTLHPGRYFNLPARSSPHL